MKSKILLFLFLTSAVAYATDHPETIHLKTKVLRSRDWYASQASLWKARVTENSGDEAWVNFYTASRYAQAPTAELEKIETEVGAMRPGSFAFHLIKAWNDSYSDEGSISLAKAVSGNPHSLAVNALSALYGEYAGDAHSRLTAIKQFWIDNGFSVSLLNYSYNVLMSIDQDGVLFTDGDNTTLPLFLLQDVFDIRKDVHILNLELLLKSDYRERRLQSAGLGLKEFNTSAVEADLKKRLCEILPRQNPERKFYYSLTLGQQPIADIKDQLYIVGLATQISPNGLDNIRLIERNLESRFFLDNLSVDFNGESEFATGKVLSGNYLLPILLLLEHYVATNEKEKLEKWEKFLGKLSNEKSKDIVNDYLGSRSLRATQVFVNANLDIKSVEGRMKLVKDKIYAGESEVTNSEYNAFLKHLDQSGQTELYENAKVDLSQYADPALTFMKTYHASPVVTKKNKYFTQYPVINVPYEGAVAYCEWMTTQYNNSQDRKFKKVKFRLPSVNEWQVAALGYKKFQSWILAENKIEMIIPKNDKDELCKGCDTKLFDFKDSDILYPWFGSYNYRNKPLNSRGCGLGNFKHPDTVKPCLPTMPTPDGWTMMSPVQAYFPNGMGLYDVVGNVAEMTAEKGKATGGSWNHSPEESTIISINEYNGPDSRVGFRVFMEVIEE
jgi:hypothetical protein